MNEALENGRPGHDARADRRSQRRNDDTSAAATPQRTHREFIGLELVMALRQLGCSTAEPIVFVYPRATEPEVKKA